MVWNYRVVHQVCEGEHCYGIHEAFFEDEREVDSVTRSPVDVSAESVEDLLVVLGRMVAACDKPVLEMDEIEAMEGE